jgi:hypothetical protein
MRRLRLPQPSRAFCDRVGISTLHKFQAGAPLLAAVARSGDFLNHSRDRRTCSGVHPDFLNFLMLSESCRFASRTPASSRTRSQ